MSRILRKKGLVITTILIVTLLVLTPPIVKAGPSNNPIFATIEKVGQMISDAVTPIQNSISNLTGRVQTNETDIQDLKDRVSALEALHVPSPSPTPQTIYVISDSTWKFSNFEQNGWLAAGFDDSSWIATEAPSSGQCPFVGGGINIGENGALNMSVSNPNWQNGTGYFRKTINLASIPNSSSVRVILDDDGDLYINGNLVLTDHDGTVAGIQTANINPSFFVSGTNAIGLVVEDSNGGCQSAQAEITINQ